MTDGWSTLYSRMRTPLYNRIKEEAKKDERTIQKWVEIHFRDYFADKDAQSCPPSTSQSSNMPPPSSD